jgi:hypothetical protein
MRFYEHLSASEKIAPGSRLARLCGWLPAQLIATGRARMRTAHNTHVSTTSRNQAINSLMVGSTNCVSTESLFTKKVKSEKPRRLGTHFARHVVDTKGKVLFARTFIHNTKIASAGKSQVKKPGVALPKLFENSTLPKLAS